MAKIYISSTFEDLKEERKAAAQAIRRLGHQEVGMEDYVACDERPVDKCLDDVNSCDGYVGIFGWRYGYIPDENNDEGKSITNLEYDAATKANIPCFIFLYKEKIKTGDVEDSKRITSLRDLLKVRHSISFYENCEDLSAKLSPALSKKFGASSKPDIPPLLPYMCNRSDQEFELAKAWQSLNQDKSRRPMAVIIHGDEQECHDKYKDRLIEKTLPKLLRLPEDENSIKEYLIEWPRPSDKLTDRCERMKANIADKISGDMGLDTSQVGAAINQHESPVMVYTFIQAIEWQKHEKELIDFWMKYWSDLPDLIVGRKLFIFLNIQYKYTSELGMLKKRKYDKLNEKIHKIVDNHAFEKYDSLYSFTLPELKAIALGDVETWVRNHAFEIGKVEKILPKIRNFFDKNNLEVFHMQQLAEELENVLKLYLEEEYS